MFYYLSLVNIKIFFCFIKKIYPPLNKNFDKKCYLYQKEVSFNDVTLTVHCRGVMSLQNFKTLALDQNQSSDFGLNFRFRFNTKKNHHKFNFLLDKKGEISNSMNLCTFSSLLLSVDQLSLSMLQIKVNYRCLSKNSVLRRGEEGI